MIGVFDHETKRVSRPRVLLDKKTSDAHDNPVISIDRAGHIWIFSTSHGRARPSFVHRSVHPHSIERFERVDATYENERGKRVPLDNFSYFQVWNTGESGFAAFFTRYRDLSTRTNMFMTSPDGVRWSRWQRLAAIEAGHYQVSRANARKAATAFNYHPKGKGLNWRTNLYYLESVDGGRTWRNAAGTAIETPVRDSASPALVHEYSREGLLVYLKDLTFDAAGHPHVLYVTSRGYASGPDNAPRTWHVARWDGDEWHRRDVTTSDNNYDMGSLVLLSDAQWQVVAPTSPGPQAFNPGGEVTVWETHDAGRTWKKREQLTRDSVFNHTYVRHPVGAHDDFWMLWADGHGRKPSHSRLYISTRDGRVYRLPTSMGGRESAPCVPVVR